MNERPTIQMEEMTDPAELAEAHLQREQFDRNSAWLQAHAKEIYSRYRGQCIGIAGEEVFVADTATQALAQDMIAHSNDKGRFVHYIPKDKMPRIDANGW